jgi:hypothetical protein
MTYNYEVNGVTRKDDTFSRVFQFGYSSGLNIDSDSDSRYRIHSACLGQAKRRFQGEDITALTIRRLS